MAAAPEDEAALVRRARAGDREAFAALLDAVLPRVRGFLHRLGAPASRLDDRTQEVFVKVIEGLARYAERSTFSTWVLGIALNVHRGRERAERAAWGGRAPAPLPDDLAAAGPSPACALDAAEAGERLAAALRRLPALLREAFLLRRVEGLAVPEAAALLGVPEGTVRRRDHEARRQLAELLGSAPARQGAER